MVRAWVRESCAPILAAMRRAVIACLFLSGCQPSTATSDADSDGGSSSTGDGLLSGGSAVPGYSTTGARVGDTTGSSSATSSSTGEPQVPALPFLPAECPGDVLTGDILDPNEVYIFGTVEPGVGGREAISHWSTPDHAVVGFSHGSDNSTGIRRTDGRLLYADVGEGVRRFHCDDCPWVPESQYPSNSLANDPIIDDCAGPGDFVRVVVAPDLGHLYRCGGTWFGASGEPRYAEEFGELLHLGHDEWALTETGVVNLEDSSFSEFIGLPEGEPIAIRADPTGGFFVAAGDYANPELFHVDLDGRAVSMGLFPPLPSDGNIFFDAALDGCLALYEIATSPIDVVYRRAIGDETRVVYSEATDPVVKLHSSKLLSGA